MQDLEQTIEMVIDFIRGIWIKKRYVMICSWLICPVGFFYIITLPDVYESDAQVYVDTRSVLQPLLVGMVIGSNPAQEIQMMARTLLSRANVEIIARQSDLDITVVGDEDYNKLIIRLTNDISLSGTGRDNIYTISYANESPEMARTVVQETLDLFVEGSLGSSQQGNDTTTRFLDEQIAEYENDLAESEQRLAAFQRKYSDILPAQGSFYANLQSLKQQMEVTKLTIKETQQQINAMKGQSRQALKAADGFGVRSNGGEQVLTTRYDDRILALEGRLDELKLRFTEQHPDVIESNNLMEALKEARQKDIDVFLAQDTDSDSPSMLTESDRQLSLEIARLEGMLASLNVREKDTQSRITELQSIIESVPQIESEETGLNRDYGIKKQKYEELLSRRESNNLTRRADSDSDDLQFRIIRPPLIADTPSGPKRILFYSGVLIFGFGLGGGIAFLMSMIKPVLVRGQQISDLTGFPIWGAVAHLDIVQIKKRNKMRMFIFAMSSGVIIMLYAGLIAVEIMNIDLASKIPL
ncbi:XrtA system polysaccharide chain length determinant [Glaciecola sp. 33A]|jgi:polysaccharide chain length determinant protein (PEP-CTERM system associated)|uniref:XrtA system polysaccharide chain length determinant n=1 Tax=Glaciecola sp. 33A TaxID=2057807 RepID=UPI000C33E60E|nr:XrtA system polysaccharide chain length determinant [Glaciecola sp. 33A]PKI02384.1 chain-length determining protein [Glaciecola sp. 33A]